MAPSPAAKPRRPADKFEDRRRELAQAALQTLGELGYARTSLREIAQNSPYSHGVVHYYFADKAELITYCVRQYKAECVTRYDEIVETSASADELAERFADALVTTMVDDAPMHRLWYDLRAQALFDTSLRENVLEIDATLEHMIWQVVSRYASLRAIEPAMPSSRVYAVLDGVFQQALLRHLSGIAGAADDLRTGALQLLELAATLSPAVNGSAVSAAGRGLSVRLG
jgi:TetR/AcrR family transcriptional repressor of bet genes